MQATFVRDGRRSKALPRSSTSELVGRIDGFEPVQPDRAEVIYGVANEISVSGTLDEWAEPGTYPTPTRSW